MKITFWFVLLAFIFGVFIGSAPEEMSFWERFSVIILVSFTLFVAFKAGREMKE